MELQTKKLEDYEFINLKNLSAKRNELTFNIGELYLEISELKKILVELQSQHSEVSTELDKLLGDLNQKYPNGEIDLQTGDITFEK